MIANPQRTHGNTRSITCDTGTRVNARPSNRTPRIPVRPTNNIRNSTCDDSSSGYMNSDSRSAVLFSVAASHSQKASSDTLGAAQVLRELFMAILADIVNIASHREHRVIVFCVSFLYSAVAHLYQSLDLVDPNHRSDPS